MTDFSKLRGFSGFIISAGVHIAFALFLIALPRQIMKHYDPVDMEVTRVQRKPPEPEPEKKEPEPEPEPEKPVEKKVVKKAKPKPVAQEEPPPPPPPTIVPEKAKEAPPVFDLGDNTFAMNGKGAGWSMARSEGNTRFAGVAKKEQAPVRNTKPVFAAPKKPSGTGTNTQYAPVPLSDLTRRPTLLGGSLDMPYPPEAKKSGLEGPVVLRLLIDKTGRVRKTQVIKSPGDVLANYAKLKLSDARFSVPLDKNGKPVDTVIVYTCRFVLDG